MLKLISVKNFALIGQLELELTGGFNVLTGETGSGKSILVDALNLLVGGRASQDLVRRGFESATVEGLFQLDAKHPVLKRLEENGLGQGSDSLLIRRVISRSGNNRVFINDRLVTLAFLAGVGSDLVDIHGQHDQQRLLELQTQRAVLDVFADSQDVVGQVAESCRELQGVQERLASLDERLGESLRQQDFLKFQIDEIEKLQLRPGVDQLMEEERRLLSSAEQRSRWSAEAYQLLYESEESTLATLKRASERVGSLAELDGEATDFLKRIVDAQYQLEGVALELRDYTDGVSFNQQQLEEVEARLAELHRAKLKYGSSVGEILVGCDRMREELEGLSEECREQESLEESRKVLLAKYRSLAASLSKRRRKFAKQFASFVQERLAELAMPGCLFEVQIFSDPDRIARAGFDDVQFQVSFNPGEDPQPLAQVTSGGELSRMALALKSLVSLDPIPRSLVFDEIDAGIGGRVASCIGERLLELSSQHQVLCVTHLAQIACRANSHLVVSKELDKDRTVIQVSGLSETERVEELARMMAGDAVSETTRQQARELLSAPVVTTA